jgi:hypothetical protein
MRANRRGRSLRDDIVREHFDELLESSAVLESSVVTVVVVGVVLS